MEMDTLQTYLRDHHIEDLVLELTEALLKEKPNHPKKFLLGKLEAEIGDGIVRPRATIKQTAAPAPDVSGHHLVR